MCEWQGKSLGYLTREFPFKIVDKIEVEKVPVAVVTSGREGGERERDREARGELLCSFYSLFLLLLPGGGRRGRA